MVACPNQDVVYGAGSIGLDVEPVVIQVPDFGDRFWVYQVVDVRTDSFADLGKMYGTKPGFYLLAGPDWQGDVPPGIAGVFRSKTNSGFVIPRVFMDDTAAGSRGRAAAGQPDRHVSAVDVRRQAETAGLGQADQVPVAGFRQRRRDAVGRAGEVSRDTSLVLDDAAPLPGEEARYAEVRALIAAARNDPALKAAMIDEATKAEQDLVTPLFQFRNYGLPVAHHWTTQSNGAAFGTDYFTRTAVAKSNIFVNKPTETKYFYQDLDQAGARLNGTRRYTVTFAKGQLPPVKGFWSLTLYNQHHFFSPNAIKRYSVGHQEQRSQAQRGRLTDDLRAG